MHVTFILLSYIMRKYIYVLSGSSAYLHWRAGKNISTENEKNSVA